MKWIFLIFLILSTILGACQKNLDPQPLPVDPPTPIYQSPVDVLRKLIEAQDNFFHLSGRFSMTLDTLVSHGFLDLQAQKILRNEAPKLFPDWHFETVPLPFPDEDVTWCYVAWGPKNRVLLAIHTGIWQRSDGICPLDRDLLPPKKPWKKVIS